MGTKNTKFSRLLLSKEISSKEVAEVTGLHKAHLSLIKNGSQNFTIETLKKLCQVLKCAPNDILDWEDWRVEEGDRTLQ